MRGGVIAASRRRVTVIPDITYLGAGAVGVQTSAGSNLTLALPTPAGGLLLNDFLIACVINNTNSTWATSAFTAAGFTRRNTGLSGTSQSPSGALFYKKAVGGESGNIVGTNPGGTAKGIVVAYRGVHTTTPFDASDVVEPFGAVAAYDVDAQTASMLNVAQFIMAWANSASGNFTPPSNPVNFTELADHTQTSTPHLWAGHLLGRPAGDTGVRNLLRSGAIRGGAIGVLLKPA